MDRIDYRILKLLQENSRQTASVISQDVHLSVSAVTERIRKMEQSGVISGYTIVVNERKLGMPMTAIMEVSLDHPKYFDSFAAAIQDMDYVVACYYQTGNYDLLLKISCASGDELERIHRGIMNLEGVSDTMTHVVLKNVKNIYSSIRKVEEE